MLSIGTRGDVQPCVALAKEMLKNSINVEIATHLEYQKLVEENGITFHELPGNPANKWDERKEGEKINIWEELENYSRKWIEKSIKICKDSNVILFTPLCFFGSSIAEKFKIPYLIVAFEPHISTKYFASPYTKAELGFIPFYNKITHFVGNQSFWLSMRKRINRLRNELLQLPPFPFWGPYKDQNKNSQYLCAYSRHLSKKPPDWGENIFISGYWFLENDSLFRLSDELKEFLGNDEKPILLDMGSFSHEKLQPKLKMIISEIKTLNQRLLIYPGKIDLEKYDFPSETFFLESDIPHSAILDHVKLFITHGGVGAIHAAMKYGVPIVPISLFGAQFYWGRILYAEVLGAKPLTITKLKPNETLNSIKYVLNSSVVSNNSEIIKKKIQNENSCEIAVDRIKQIVENN